MINITFGVDFFSILSKTAMIIILLAMIMMNIMIIVIMMRMIITSQGLAIMTFLMIIVRDLVKKKWIFFGQAGWQKVREAAKGLHR